MLYAETLIDKASKVCGGDAALARRLGISKPLLSMMKSGNRAMTPAKAAELADIAGEDAIQATINAVIDSAKGTPKEGVLKDILGKALAAGEAAMLAISYKNDSKTATNNIAKSFTRGKQAIHRI